MHAPPVRIAATGDLDVFSARGLRDALSDELHRGHRPVIVDLSDVGSIDSFTLATLLNALRRLTRQGRAMVVVCPHGEARRLLVITRLERELGVVDSVLEAEALLAA